MLTIYDAVCRLLSLRSLVSHSGILDRTGSYKPDNEGTCYNSYDIFFLKNFLKCL